MKYLITINQINIKYFMILMLSRSANNYYKTQTKLYYFRVELNSSVQKSIKTC